MLKAYTLPWGYIYSWKAQGVNLQSAACLPTEAKDCLCLDHPLARMRVQARSRFA